MRLMVIGGFLGAGKTSLITAWAQALLAEGRKVAVVENEAGKVGLDDAFLRDQCLEVFGLLGGCACCDFQDRLVNEMKRIRDLGRHDYVLLEPSGVASVENILGTIKRFVSPGLNMKCVSIVDATRFEIMRKNLKGLLLSQLACAEHVVVSKIDLVEAPYIADIAAELERLNPAARIWEANLTDGLPAGFSSCMLLEDSTEFSTKDLPTGGRAPAPYSAASWEVFWPAEGVAMEPATTLVRDLAKKYLSDGGTAIGHIKLLSEGEDRRGTLISATSPDHVSVRGARPGTLIGKCLLAVITVNANSLDMEEDLRQYVRIHLPGARIAPATNTGTHP